MKRYLAIFAAIGAMTLSTAVAQTDTTTQTTPAPAGRMAMRARMHQEFMQALNLTDAQKQQAKTIMQNSRQQAQPLVQQLRQNREALRAAEEANDTAKIQQLSAKIGTLHGQVMAIRATGKAQFYALLTPDQKAKAEQFHQNMKERMKERFGTRSREQ